MSKYGELGSKFLEANGRVDLEHSFILPFMAPALSSSSSATVSAVARIAYIASDVVVDSQPSLFHDTYISLSYSGGVSPTKIDALPQAADAGSALLHHDAATLVSYTTLADSQTLRRLIPHLQELSDRPVVLHVALRPSDDLSDALILRTTHPFTLLSRTSQEAHDHALLASRLAQRERRAVLHLFYLPSSQDAPVPEITEEKIQSFLQDTPAKLQNGHVNGHANGHVNGFANGHANGDVNKDMPLSTSLREAYHSAALMTLALVRRPMRPLTSRGSDEPHTVVFILGYIPEPFQTVGVRFVDISLLSPLPISDVNSFVPPSTERVVVLEQVHSWATKWTPLFLEIVAALQTRDPRPKLLSATIGSAKSITPTIFAKFLASLESASSRDQLMLGTVESCSVTIIPPHVPLHESAYTKILTHLFGERLDIANSPDLVTAHGSAATNPEYALGRVRGQLEERASLFAAVEELMRTSRLPKDLHALLTKWSLAKHDPIKSRELGTEVLSALGQSTAVSAAAADRIRALKSHLGTRSRWIIGSDAWSYDLGASGLHHAIASGLDVNILILDTLPYSQRSNAEPRRRKRDAGLYAMNHGDVYVASVAVYSSYGQVLQALVEADAFKGPSVVLAYLPYVSEDEPALQLLKETKRAVDAGYWPLYRWNPSKPEPFALDSDAIKNDLREFLDRQNHISQLVRADGPQLASELVGSLGQKVRETRQERAKAAFDAMLGALGGSGPPVLVLYASDGGAAEKIAKRLTRRAQARGLSATVQTLDSVSIEQIADAEEEHVVFITSTAGQGEPPQNGRTLFKAINAAANGGARPFEGKVKFTVFGMGDSHYWPRPEDAHYYNKPGQDLDRRLDQLGGERVADIGLGDDQDEDGPETGYRAWEPLVWKTLGVDNVEVLEAEPEPITNEHIKAASNYLRGTVAEGLKDTSTGALAPSDTQLTKFHGIYQQDDRDIRDERQAEGVEPAYSFMIRVRMPGGVCTPEQWLAMDQIADEHGNGTFKITTRATFQFHGVIKRHLKPSIQVINRSLLDTLAACGDVNRNVIVSAIPSKSKLHAQVYDFAKTVSERLLPNTSAYHEIWLDKKMVAGDAVKDFEPLYGEFYLPRKFKIAVAVPPTNDVDVFCNDVGFIAIVDNSGELAGFNVTVGGGMGVTHSNKKTYPRLGSVIGFCTVEQGGEVAEKIMLVQRDNGNRVDRKNARLKYTIDRMGVDNFKAEVEKLLGYSLPPARDFKFDRNIDDFGWHTGENGKHHYTVFIENGRIQDEPDRDFKAGLREIAKIHEGQFRLTANQHLLISEVATEDVPKIKRLLAEYKLDNLNYTGLRLSSSACVAFPTCGLAMAESERYLPLLINKVESICEENGLRNDSIVMRMTGCPNGCARPYVAEVAFVGKAPGSYLMLLGGGYHGERLNKIYRENVSEPQILSILRPMIKRYALERQESEHFGDWVIRAGYIAATTMGKEWYDRMGGEGEHREVVV